MDIEELIEEEAPLHNDPEEIHDKAYAKELRRAYSQFSNMREEALMNEYDHARMTYDTSHRKTADCVVLYNLLKGGDMK